MHGGTGRRAQLTPSCRGGPCPGRGMQGPPRPCVLSAQGTTTLKSSLLLRSPRCTGWPNAHDIPSPRGHPRGGRRQSPTPDAGLLTPGRRPACHLPEPSQRCRAWCTPSDNALSSTIASRSPGQGAIPAAVSAAYRSRRRRSRGSTRQAMRSPGRGGGSGESHAGARSQDRSAAAVKGCMSLLRPVCASLSRSSFSTGLGLLARQANRFAVRSASCRMP